MAFYMELSDMKTFPPDRQIFPGLKPETGKNFEPNHGCKSPNA
jgi:hypothetical protein